MHLVNLNNMNFKTQASRVSINTCLEGSCQFFLNNMNFKTQATDCRDSIKKTCLEGSAPSFPVNSRSFLEG